MTIDEEINRCEKLASDYEFNLNMHKNHIMNLSVNDIERMQGCLVEHKQRAEWLKELQRWREFGDWIVKAVLDDDWEDNADFYAEVLCRKLTKLGKLKLKDHKYMEVNANE